MATTYELIDKTTLGSGGAASVTFSSIPNTYTDLKVVVNARQQPNGTLIKLTFNGSSSSYSNVRLYGTGSSVGSDTADTTFISNTMVADGTFTANTFGNGEFYIPNYNSSNYKSVLVDGVTENNGTTALAMFTAGLWSNTAAITSITISAQLPNFTEHSSFYLYGIKNS